MKHRFINWAIALAILLVMIAIQHIDARDIQSTEVKQRREYMAAISVCNRMYGPQTAPEYTDNSLLICRSRRGEILSFRAAEK